MLNLNNLWVLLGVLGFVLLEVVLVLLKRKAKWGFTLQTFSALVLGIAFGVVLQVIFGAETSTGAGASIDKWLNIVGQLFTRALQLVIVPLVAVSLVSAFGKFTDSKEGLKKAGRIIGFLLVTTAVASVISIMVTKFSHLSVSNLIAYSDSTRKPADIAQTLLNLIPSNFVAAFASNSVLPIVFLSAILGFVFLSVKKKDPVTGAKFEGFLTVARDFVMTVVDLVIDFTPYGVLPIVAVRAAQGSGSFIAQLGFVIIVCYISLVIVLLLHILIALAAGVSPLRYIRESVPAWLFAFSSRSSAATVPLTIEAQKRLGVGDVNADLAASLGTCIGQNACAGVYPTMLAILVALVQGWNVWTPAFLLPLILYVVIASIGTAGVGGGATNVSLVVLSFMGLPVELVAILISVDFIIDMGRTLVNVSDSILAGIVSSRLEGKSLRQR
jgi:L-cystine uptake protein TcyP (sodium:dicarboxylate symporter family)